MYYLYILKSEKFFKTYVGISRNLKQRIQEHNSGSSCFTKRYRPWRLMYYEVCLSRTEARKREKYFKTASGRKKIYQILNDSAVCLDSRNSSTRGGPVSTRDSWSSSTRGGPASTRGVHRREAGLPRLATRGTHQREAGSSVDWKQKSWLPAGKYIKFE